MGGLSNVKREQVSVVVPIILISLFFLLANKWKLNLLTFGDEEAAAMGVNVQRTRALVIIFSTLMSSAAISVCGLIGWVGIVVPHCARLLVGANNQRVLPVATLLGGVYLMIIDLLARMLLMVEIPLGILTALIGTPFFLWILFRGQILRGTE
jgi:iron complex transport system permease protein